MRLTSLLVIIACLAINSCGFKGPLTLPEEQPDQTKKTTTK